MELYEFIHTPEELKTHKLKIEKVEQLVQAKRKEAESIQYDIKIQEMLPQKHSEIVKILEAFQEVITEAKEPTPRAEAWGFRITDAVP